MRRLEVLGFEARAVALRWFGRFLVVYQVHFRLVSAGDDGLIATMRHGKMMVIARTTSVIPPMEDVPEKTDVLPQRLGAFIDGSDRDNIALETERAKSFSQPAPTRCAYLCVGLAHE